MPPLIYYNPAPSIPGCQCNNCVRWINNANNKLKIGTLIGSRNMVGEDDLRDIVLLHDDRPMRLFGIEKLAIESFLLLVVPIQEHQFVNPDDNFVFVWGQDVFTDEQKWFFSGTEVLFNTALIKKTQYKLMNLTYCIHSTIINLFDIETGRKISYSITESPWREQIVRLWRASVPCMYGPPFLHGLTSPLDPAIDADAIEYVQNVPWTVPRYDTRSRSDRWPSYHRSLTLAMMVDLRNVKDYMNPNNILFSLPDDLILCIVDWLEPEAQAVIRRVCRRFEKMIRRPVTVTILEWMNDKRITEMKIWEYL